MKDKDKEEETTIISQQPPSLIKRTQNSLLTLFNAALHAKSPSPLTPLDSADHNNDNNNDNNTINNNENENDENENDENGNGNDDDSGDCWIELEEAEAEEENDENDIENAAQTMMMTNRSQTTTTTKTTISKFSSTSIRQEQSFQVISDDDEATVIKRETKKVEKSKRQKSKTKRKRKFSSRSNSSSSEESEESEDTSSEESSDEENEKMRKKRRRFSKKHQKTSLHHLRKLRKQSSTNSSSHVVTRKRFSMFDRAVWHDHDQSQHRIQLSFSQELFELKIYSIVTASSTNGSHMMNGAHGVNGHLNGTGKSGGVNGVNGSGSGALKDNTIEFLQVVHIMYDITGQFTEFYRRYSCLIDVNHYGGGISGGISGGDNYDGGMIRSCSSSSVSLSSHGSFNSMSSNMSNMSSSNNGSGSGSGMSRSGSCSTLFSLLTNYGTIKKSDDEMTNDSDHDGGDGDNDTKFKSERKKLVVKPLNSLTIEMIENELCYYYSVQDLYDTYMATYLQVKKWTKNKDDDDGDNDDDDDDDEDDGENGGRNHNKTRNVSDKVIVNGGDHTNETMVNEQLATEGDLIDFLLTLGFLSSPDQKYLRVPDFFLLPIYFAHHFTNESMQSKQSAHDQIFELREMLSNTLDTLLLKLYRENRDAYDLFSDMLKRKPIKSDPPTPLKDTILSDMYRVAIDRCKPNQPVYDPSIFTHPVKYFQPASRPICADIDHTHTIVYLGFCYRDNPYYDSTATVNTSINSVNNRRNNSNHDFFDNEDDDDSDDGAHDYSRYPFEMDSNGKRKKYAVITAYFCNDPVMVDYERISFHYQRIERLGLNHYAIFWENGEITFDSNKEEEWKRYKKSNDVIDIDVPEYDPHPLEDYCEELTNQELPDDCHQLLNEILADMKKPYWRIFCKIPKTSALFEAEVTLIAKYVQQFKQIPSVHLMIYGLSLLLGRFPDTIVTHLQSLGVMKTFSALVYHDEDENEQEKDYNQLQDEEQMFEAEKANLVSKIRAMFQQNGKNFALSRILQYNSKGELSLDHLKKMLTNKNKRWDEKIKDSNSYFFQATIAVNGAINDDFESVDFDDSDHFLGSRSSMVTSTLSSSSLSSSTMNDPCHDLYSHLPKSMHKVRNEYYYKFDDISRGYAKHPVPVINSRDRASLGSFVFTVENKVFNNQIKLDMDLAIKHSPLQCTCGTGKRTSRAPCTSGCSCSTMYTASGRLKKTYMEASVAIRECGKFCTCDPKLCPNRVLQRGCNVRLQLFKTKDKGWGVMTLDDLKPYTFVGEYVGEVVTEYDAENRGRTYDQVFGCSYLFDMTEFKDNKYIIDANKYCNTSRWFNHSCEPNMVCKQFKIDTSDRMFTRLGFFTVTSVAAGTELTFDYQYKPQGNILCKCGSKQCREWLQ